MADYNDEIEGESLGLPMEHGSRFSDRLGDNRVRRNEHSTELERLWASEANRRFKELLLGVVEGIPAKEVFSTLRAHDKKDKL